MPETMEVVTRNVVISSGVMLCLIFYFGAMWAVAWGDVQRWKKKYQELEAVEREGTQRQQASLYTVEVPCPNPDCDYKAWKYKSEDGKIVTICTKCGTVMPQNLEKTND